MEHERLAKQIQFIIEIDKQKQIYRRTLLMDGSRTENDAEHSWHLAVMAILLSEYADEEIDISKVIKMVLVHDLVEIYAGDTFCYDAKAGLDKDERENKSADCLFSILPEDQGKEFRMLWEEFEVRETPEASFAAALDRLQPLLHNYKTNGGTWRLYNVTKDMVIDRVKPIKNSSNTLWELVERIIDECIKKGYLNEGKASLEKEKD